jgi:hypothetical protein
MKISKSKFCAGAQCLKRLYLLVHEPKLAEQPSAAVQAIMQQGHEVGMLARQLFPGGVEVRSDRGLDQAIRATRELVTNHEIPAIFEGVFEHGGVLVKVDILHRRRDKRWRLIEVKSSTSVKEEHLDDVAIQYRVLSRCGLDVGSCCLAHVNRNYVFSEWQRRSLAFLSHSKRHAASREAPAEADLPAPVAIHRPVNAESSRHCARSSVQRSCHLRIL